MVSLLGVGVCALYVAFCVQITRRPLGCAACVRTGAAIEYKVPFLRPAPVQTHPLCKSSIEGWHALRSRIPVENQLTENVMQITSGQREPENVGVILDRACEYPLLSAAEERDADVRKWAVLRSCQRLMAADATATCCRSCD